jgi:hypothetical protein
MQPHCKVRGYLPDITQPSRDHKILAARPEAGRLCSRQGRGRCRRRADHGPAARQTAELGSELGHQVLHVRREFGKLNGAVAVGVAVAQSIEQRPGEYAVGVKRKLDEASR